MGASEDNSLEQRARHLRRSARWWPTAHRPASAGFRLINFLHDRRLPYPAVEEVRAHYRVSIRAEGKRHASWCAPTRPGRDSIVKAWHDGRSAAWRGPATGVVSAGNRPALITGAIAAAWALATFLL